MRVATFAGGVTLSILGALASGACTTKQPTPSTFFDRSIAPTLQTSCVHTNTGVGCHIADAKGNAFGNLDMSSYAGVNARRDLLLDYGPYLQPSMLVKNIPPFQVTVQLWDGTKTIVTTDIKHTGGPIFDPTGSDYTTLRRWIENGATENNTGVPPTTLTKTDCTHDVPNAPGFDPNTDPPDLPMFAAASQVLSDKCASGNCHGTPVNALYLTCGISPVEVRWNYFAAVDYLAATAEQSEIVRRPLASSQGGSYHEGGPIFTTVDDQAYKDLKAWGDAHGPPQPANLDSGFLFFAKRVQPVLVKKGCMMAQCHSASMFHDYRLRGGSAGSFSLHASQRNYAFSVAQMSFESDDVNASRLVRKNLYRPEVMAGSEGITHRGGPLLEDFRSQLATGALCDQGGDGGAYDYDNGDLDAIPAYCVIREWHTRERTNRKLAALSAIAYVSRPVPPAPDRPQDFDVFAGGASLHLAAATLTATGGVALGADTPFDLTTCGLGATPDVRRPTVSWDGKRIAFAARSTAADPLAVYVLNLNGSGCAKEPTIAAHDAMGNGRLEHDFDPVFSPPGSDGIERLVFASTRGNLDSSSFEYSGPQGTPSDPSKPNANLYVLEPDPAAAGAQRVRQLTWQLNMERFPSFMEDGRIIFTAEKREPNFYQLALRRQNLDGGDYHPLYAQRGSIGYPQATGGVEIATKNFIAVLSQPTALHGAGALAMFNRSIGVDFTSQTPGDYLIDPSVLDAGAPQSPESNFFLHSLSTPATDGSYTSPSPLPDGNVLVSFGTGAPDSFGGDYDVYVMNPVTSQKTKLLGAAGTAEVDAVAVYERVGKGIFDSPFDEPNGHTTTDPTLKASDVTILDVPVLASLLFQNTPTGRLVESDLASFDVYEDLPPDVTSFPPCGDKTVCDKLGPTGMVYTRRRLAGTVPVQGDKSAHFRVPGGMPFVLKLGPDAESVQMNLPRWQREAMTFAPGEFIRQGFPHQFFDGICAGCHNSISGRPVDSAVRPDFLSQASVILNLGSNPVSDFSGPRGGPVIGPDPSSP
jgi:hypothetical protein